jgi:hypothetical protein
MDTYGHYGTLETLPQGRNTDFVPSSPGWDRGNPGGTIDASSDNMMLATIVLLGFAVAGLAVGMIVTATAPVGYQDEKGFHFGAESTVPHTDEAFGFEVSHAKA